MLHMKGRQPLLWEEQSSRTALWGCSMQTGHRASSHSLISASEGGGSLDFREEAGDSFSRW